MNYLVDYHIHSMHSVDSRSSIQEICQSAIEKGLQEIAITDHFEPTAGDELYSFYDQKAYWADIMNAKQFFRGKLKIKMGVELGQPHYFLEGAQNVMEDFPYDYVIGSAHKQKDGRDMSELNYSTMKMEDVCSMYLEQINLLLKWEDFDCVGHLDLVKRYSALTYGKNLTLSCQYELLTQVLRNIIAKGKGIEINTSGLRQAPKETMPGLDVLEIYHKLGGEILTIGSDAHKKEDIGKGIIEAIELAKQAGFTYISVFDERKPKQIKIVEQKAFSAVKR